MPKTPQELYQEREKRVDEAIALKKRDRVPVVPLFMGFSFDYAGYTKR
jgi:hypothetical protein